MTDDFGKMLGNLAGQFDQAAQPKAQQPTLDNMAINTMANFGPPKWIEHRPYPNSGEQTAARKPDGSHEIDRQDGLGPVPTQPYCADCDSPCEFGECDPPHLCRKHAACARCNP